MSNSRSEGGNGQSVRDAPAMSAVRLGGQGHGSVAATFCVAALPGMDHARGTIGANYMSAKTHRSGEARSNDSRHRERRRAAHLAMAQSAAHGAVLRAVPERYVDRALNDDHRLGEDPERWDGMS